MHRIPFPSRVVPLLSALLVASVVVTASIAAMTLGPATDTAGTATSAISSPSVSAALSGRGGDERASRSGLREIPSSSPTTPAPAPSTKKPVPPSGGGTVTGSGTCGASFYSDGQRTANGEWFNPNDFTAANRTLPFNTRVRITNLANGKVTVVRVNDRGPFVYSRCFDLSRAAFAAIASLGAGVITVKYEVLS